MTVTPLGVAVQKDKDRPGCDDCEPDAPWSSRNEPLSEFDEAPKPENLAGYKDQEQGEEDQIETGELVETCFQEYNTRKDQ
jgi:hypothetical protein